MNLWSSEGPQYSSEAIAFLCDGPPLCPDESEDLKGVLSHTEQ